MNGNFNVNNDIFGCIKTFNLNSLLPRFDKNYESTIAKKKLENEIEKKPAINIRDILAFKEFSVDFEVKKYDEKDIEKLGQTSKHFKYTCLSALYALRYLL